ncbi:DUF2975 domain-containing protein [Streptomyces sp. NPDC001339]|uniref:DUF2975 domain-containing protein n=1 Tax=Streptomyces sp. NPDC001339 TaxID=3364563 RepID=UPI00367C2431
MTYTSWWARKYRSWWTQADSYIPVAAVALALLFVGLFHILLPVLQVTGPLSPLTSREVHVDAAAQPPGTALSGAVTLRSSSLAELTFTAPGLGQRVLLVLPGLLNGLLIVVILAAVLRIARTFRDGDFFMPKNAQRLAVVAGALFLMGFLVPLADMMTTNLLARGTPMAEAISPAKTYAIEPVFLALLIGAMAGAFRSGTRLRADTEGLV